MPIVCSIQATFADRLRRLFHRHAVVAVSNRRASSRVSRSDLFGCIQLWTPSPWRHQATTTARHFLTLLSSFYISSMMNPHIRLYLHKNAAFIDHAVPHNRFVVWPPRSKVSLVQHWLLSRRWEIKVSKRI